MRILVWSILLLLVGCATVTVVTGTGGTTSNEDDKGVVIKPRKDLK